MDAFERQHIGTLRESVQARLEAAAGAPWTERRMIAASLLAEVNAAWWRVHELDSAAYLRDLDCLNRLAGWTRDFAQVGEWRSAHGQMALIPPKFFGGNPLELEEQFVASMSLNHAILPADNADFGLELGDQQNADAAFAAHRDYFLRSYAYPRFFRPRAQVLHAFASALNSAEVPPETDWRTVNLRYALYIELFPTRSKRFRPPPQTVTYNDLAAASFVTALNVIVHDVVLRILRPKRILLAGKDTWNAWPDSGLAQMGSDVGERVRPVGRRCPVHLVERASAVSGNNVLMVRTNFLRTVYGPNSEEELRRLGRDVLARHGLQGE